ncbi:MAG: adenylyl-sulfate kinase [Phycisphaerae bacterium]|jgi:adenylylsulfate kinase|nr:adenylyl-sulfate kinase [Phycisphaerae bacterium]
MKSTNITWHGGQVSAADRSALLGQRGCVVWLTGLSGSGKSTIARVLESQLIGNGRLAYVLDGDNVRHGLNSDLGFAPTDRQENIRRISELSGLFADAGIITVAAFISPYRAGRERAREIVGPERFVEAYLDVSLEECEKRDPKGLYQQARAGEIADFTGIDAPYEAPENPQIRITTEHATPADAAGKIMEYLAENKFLSAQ